MNLPDTLFTALSGVPLLALQDADLPDITTGQTIAGTIVLLTMGLSGLMLGIWYVRYQQLGFTIPTANRGILRVPMPGLVAALVLAFVICLMVTASLFIPVEALPIGEGPGVTAETAAVEKPAEPALTDTEAPAQDSPLDATQVESTVTAEPTPPTAIPTSPEVAAADPQIASSDEATSPESTDATEPSSDAQPTAAKPATPPMSRDDLLSILFQTTIFDLCMFGLFALILIVASHRGRVAIPLMLANPFSRREGPDQADFRGLTPVTMPIQLWPDLDDPTVSKPVAAEARPTQILSTPSSDTSTVTQPEVDGMAVPANTPSGASSGMGFAADYPIPAHVPAERFSLVTEFRWACEVFLAAYLPTSLLRFVIISLVIALTGEQPSSHPFLEMMDKELDPTILGMIVLLAVVMAPIVEELFYRVVILGGLAQYNYVRSGLVVSSVVFCMAHGFPDSLSLLPLAFALGFTYLHRRSYITVMMVHFLFNAFNMVIAGVAMLM